MTYKTYDELSTKIKRDLDIEEEDFVQPTELMEYFNDAIRECEAHIHKLGLEDLYFKTSDTPSLVSGTADYNMPTGIFASKLLECVYANGTRVFEVKRLKGSNKHVRKAEINAASHSEPIYLFDIINASAAAGVKWQLIPSAKETSTNITRWFIREATRMTSDASICDIPDICHNFMYAFVAWRVWGKEGDGRAAAAFEEKERQKELMLETLREMIADDETHVEADTSAYDEAT